MSGTENFNRSDISALAQQVDIDAFSDSEQGRIITPSEIMDGSETVLEAEVKTRLKNLYGKVEQHRAGALLKLRGGLILLRGEGEGEGEEGEGGEGKDVYKRSWSTLGIDMKEIKERTLGSMTKDEAVLLIKKTILEEPDREWVRRNKGRIVPRDIEKNKGSSAWKGAAQTEVVHEKEELEDIDISGVKWYFSGLESFQKIAVVFCVQRLLEDTTYDCGTVDGVLGPKTKQAIKEFQRANGLHVDGVPGRKTVQKLFEVHGGIKVSATSGENDVSTESSALILDTNPDDEDSYKNNRALILVEGDAVNDGSYTVRDDLSDRDNSRFRVHHLFPEQEGKVMVVKKTNGTEVRAEWERDKQENIDTYCRVDTKKRVRLERGDTITFQAKERPKETGHAGSTLEVPSNEKLTLETPSEINEMRQENVKTALENFINTISDNNGNWRFTLLNNDQQKFVVACVEKLLEGTPYDCGTVDGVLEPKTKQAIEKFQRANDLHVDGTPGRKTVQKLFEVHGGIEAPATSGEDDVSTESSALILDTNPDDEDSYKNNRTLILVESDTVNDGSYTVRGDLSDRDNSRFRVHHLFPEQEGKVMVVRKTNGAEVRAEWGRDKQEKIDTYRRVDTKKRVRLERGDTITFQAKERQEETGHADSTLEVSSDEKLTLETSSEINEMGQENVKTALEDFISTISDDNGNWRFTLLNNDQQKFVVACVEKLLEDTVDGVLGPKTKQAIEEFQRANDLHVDGTPGKKTVDALLIHGTAPAAPEVLKISDIAAPEGVRIDSNSGTIIADGGDVNGRVIGTLSISDDKKRYVIDWDDTNVGGDDENFEFRAQNTREAKGLITGALKYVRYRSRRQSLIDYDRGTNKYSISLGGFGMKIPFKKNTELASSSLQNKTSVSFTHTPSSGESITITIGVGEIEKYTVQKGDGTVETVIKSAVKSKVVTLLELAPEPGLKEALPVGVLMVNKEVLLKEDPSITIGTLVKNGNTYTFDISNTIVDPSVSSLPDSVVNTDADVIKTAIEGVRRIHYYKKWHTEIFDGPDTFKHVMGGGLVAFTEDTTLFSYGDLSAWAGVEKVSYTETGSGGISVDMFTTGSNQHTVRYKTLTFSNIDAGKVSKVVPALASERIYKKKREEIFGATPPFSSTVNGTKYVFTESKLPRSGDGKWSNDAVVLTCSSLNIELAFSGRNFVLRHSADDERTSFTENTAGLVAAIGSILNRRKALTDALGVFTGSLDVHKTVQGNITTGLAKIAESNVATAMLQDLSNHFNVCDTYVTTAEQEVSKVVTRSEKTQLSGEINTNTASLLKSIKSEIGKVKTALEKKLEELYNSADPSRIDNLPNIDDSVSDKTALEKRKTELDGKYNALKVVSDFSYTNMNDAVSAIQARQEYVKEWSALKGDIEAKNSGGIFTLDSLGSTLSDGITVNASSGEILHNGTVLGTVSLSGDGASFLINPNDSITTIRDISVNSVSEAQEKIMQLARLNTFLARKREIFGDDFTSADIVQNGTTVSFGNINIDHLLDVGTVTFQESSTTEVRKISVEISADIASTTPYRVIYNREKSSNLDLDGAKNTVILLAKKRTALKKRQDLLAELGSIAEIKTVRVDVAAHVWNTKRNALEEEEDSIHRDIPTEEAINNPSDVSAVEGLLHALVNITGRIDSLKKDVQLFNSKMDALIPWIGAYDELVILRDEISSWSPSASLSDDLKNSLNTKKSSIISSIGDVLSDNNGSDFDASTTSVSVIADKTTALTSQKNSATTEWNELKNKEKVAVEGSKRLKLFTDRKKVLFGDSESILTVKKDGSDVPVDFSLLSSSSPLPSVSDMEKWSVLNEVEYSHTVEGNTIQIKINLVEGEKDYAVKIGGGSYVPLGNVGTLKRLVASKLPAIVPEPAPSMLDFETSMDMSDLSDAVEIKKIRAIERLGTNAAGDLYIVVKGEHRYPLINGAKINLKDDAGDALKAGPNLETVLNTHKWEILSAAWGVYEATGRYTNVRILTNNEGKTCFVSYHRHNADRKRKGDDTKYKYVVIDDFTLSDGNVITKDELFEVFAFKLNEIIVGVSDEGINEKEKIRRASLRLLYTSFMLKSTKIKGEGKFLGIFPLQETHETDGS
jgi:peptidoglycan hydrolase-like protein with peptidoglycan-binding domain